MSLSWRDRLTAFVAPGTVRVAVRSRGWRSRAARADASLEGAAVTVGDAVDDLAVQLMATLRSVAGSRRFDATVVLSNEFVRYAVVDAAGQLHGAEERTAAAAQALRSVYGAASEGWHIVMDESATDAALVAGVPRALVDALHAACKSAGAHGVAIEPLLSHAFNDARAGIEAGTGWIGVVESGRVVLASLGDAGVAAVRSQRLQHDAATEVAALVQRARLLDGTPAGRTTLLLASDRPVAAAFAPESGLRSHAIAVSCLQDEVGAA